MAKLCACGCGEEVNKRDYKKGHKPLTDGGAGSGTASPKAARRPRQMSAGDDVVAETVKVSVGAEFFDAWFAGKSLREKAQIFEAAGV